MKTNKPLFCAGGAMMSFYFLAATDMDDAIDIMNKDPKKPVDKFFHLPPASLNSMLIDPITGDLYGYDYGKRKWMPKVNSGMHYKQMNEVHPVFKKINSRLEFSVHAVEEEYPLVKGVNVESIVHVDNVTVTLHAGLYQPLLDEKCTFKLSGNQSIRLATSPCLFLERRKKVCHICHE
jgi:hypothetical protein